MATAVAKTAPAGELVLDEPGSRGKFIQENLGKRIAKIEEVLPAYMKGQADRLVKRAMLTFIRNSKLQECTAASFIQCVIDGAEIGIAVDGKLGYAVPYKNKKRGSDGRDEWFMEARFQPDYKALVAIAKRSGQVNDCYGDVVCVNDQFVHGRAGGTNRLEHSWELGQDRGDVIGAYAIVKLFGGDWRYELMDLEALHAIRGRSKAKDYGPWVTDYNQMLVKTVVRRILKMYCNDPGFERALELDEHEYVENIAARPRTGSVADALAVPSAAPKSQYADHSTLMLDNAPVRHDDPAERTQGKLDDADHNCIGEPPELKVGERVQFVQADYAAFGEVISKITVTDEVRMEGDKLLKQGADPNRIAEYVNERLEQIRGGRGERSNPKPKQKEL